MPGKRIKFTFRLTPAPYVHRRPSRARTRRYLLAELRGASGESPTKRATTMRIAVIARMRADRAGTLPLYVRIEHRGETAYVNLGLRVPKREWNARKGEARLSYDHADDLNAILAEKRAAAQRAALAVQGRSRHVSLAAVRAAVEEALNPEPEAPPAPAADFIAYCREALRAYEARGQVATAYAYGSGLNALVDYAGEPLPFEAVTPALVRGFHAHLTGKLRRKPNSTHKYVSALRTIARQAERDGVPGAAGAVRALAAVKLRKERGDKQRLTFEQVRAVEALDLPPGRVRDVRDWFIASFYLGGMRFVDVCTLRWQSVDTSERPWFVRWRQVKTGGAQGLPAVGAAQTILESWHERTGPEGAEPSPFVFGLLTEAEAADPRVRRARVSSWNALARKNLKAICARAGVPVVGPHASRHSVADHLRKSGLSLWDVSKILGHANARITEFYMKAFDEEEVGDKLTRALRAPGS